MPRGAAATLLVAAACLALGCTGTSTGDRPTATPAVPGATAPSSTEPVSTEPLVLAVHPSRAPVRIDLTTARGIRHGSVTTWRALDGTAAPLTVVRSPRPRARLARDTVQVLPASRMRPWLTPVIVAGVDPLRRPAAYPLRVAGPTPPPVTTVRLVGDIMLGRRVAGANPGTEPASPLRPLARHLAGATVTIGNLESTLSTAGPPQQGDDSFAAPPDAVQGLARLGIDALSLANNHTGDYGTTALLETVRRVRGSGIAPFGAGRDVRRAGRPAVLETPELRIGVVGFNAIGETPAATDDDPGALTLRMPPRTGPLDRTDLRRVAGLVRALADRVDVVVVVPHWGTQYTHTPGPEQRLVARRLVAAGADLVVGGHPHWVQGMDRVGDAVVMHSLGNLVFDMDFMAQTMEGVTLTATFWGSRLVGVTLSPYVLDDRFRPRLVGGARGGDILRDVWSHSTGPFRSGN